MFLDGMCAMHICKTNHIRWQKREAAHNLLCSILMIDCDLYVLLNNLRQLVMFRAIINFQEKQALSME